MFYSKFMFVKKGPLSKVWIAAHFSRKLNKSLVQGTDINISAKSILDPATPLALRLSGQLLLGLVRIFQKKVKYLQEDCSDALTKMKMIFRPGAVDLPPDSAVAPSNQITHADNYEMIEYAVPDIPLDNFEDGVDDHQMDASELSLPNNLDSISALAPDITMPDQDFNDDLLADFGGGDGMLAPFELGDDGILADGGLHDDGMLGEDSKMGGDVSDIEVGRAAALASQEGFDVDVGKDVSLAEDGDSVKDRSHMAAELSAFDTTTDMDEGGFGGDSVLTDLAPVMPETPIVAPKPRVPKKRKLAKRDARTELSGLVISESLKDTSDITIEGGRPTIPFTKRAKLRQSRQVVGLSAVLKRPSGLVHLNHEEPAMADELVNIISRSREMAREGKVDGHEEEQEEEVLEEQEEVSKEVAAEDAALEIGQDDYDFGGFNDMSMDDTTIASKSVAPTPTKAPEEEEEEITQTERVVYSENLEEDQKELEEFFGSQARATKEDGLFGWNDRTRKMQQVLVNSMKNKSSIDLGEVIADKHRSVAAAAFYQLLVLKSHSIIQVEQPEPFADITISELKKTSRVQKTR